MLVVFLVPPIKLINGGVLSIYNLCAESRVALGNDATVVIATHPGFSTYGRNDLFDNDEEVFAFDSLPELYPHIGSILIHIPEYAVDIVFHGLTKHRAYLESLDTVHLNILNQNIEVMADEHWTASLLTISPQVTQTTAFARYTDQALADRYSIPTHWMSVREDPRQFTRRAFHEKEDIVAVSYDPPPRRSEFIEKVRKDTPFRIVEIENMTYPEYKDLVSRAKFTVTFGEGMDGYFTESTHSGSIGVAVFNETFFPRENYLALDNVYPDYEALLTKATTDMLDINGDPERYASINKSTAELLAEDYREDEFTANVAAFYRGDYTYLPTPGAREKFMVKAVQRKDELLTEAQSAVAESSRQRRRFSWSRR